MKLRIAVSVLATVLSIATTAAAAAEPTPEQRQAVRAACQADLMKVCAGIQPGGGRIAACAKAKFDQLSPPCQQALMAMKQGG